MGLLMASTRVYVNEGSYHDLWVSSTWALNPFDIKGSVARKFKPGEFDLINTARKDPNSPWMQTEKRMPNMALFLTTYDSFPLKDAKEAEQNGKPQKRRQGLPNERCRHVEAGKDRIRRQLRLLPQQQAAKPDAERS